MELPNTYYHCMGCDVLLGRDLNICMHCYSSRKAHLTFNQMHPFSNRNRSDCNHNGSLIKKDRKKGCPCREGLCKRCGYCQRCSCRCHNEMKRMQRFYGKSTIQDIVKNCKELAAAAVEE